MAMVLVERFEALCWCLEENGTEACTGVGTFKTYEEAELVLAERVKEMGEGMVVGQQINPVQALISEADLAREREQALEETEQNPVDEVKSVEEPVQETENTEGGGI